MVLQKIFSRRLFNSIKTIQYSSNTFRYYSKTHLKVTVCGAAGNVGQPLSLILKQSPYIDELALYDLQSTTGLAMELGHIDTKCIVSSYNQQNSCEAFQDASIVVFAIGTSTGNAKESCRQLEHNAPIVNELLAHVVDHCPKALIAIATNPVDAIVPFAAELLKCKNAYNKSSLFGITSLNIVRANTFVAETLGLEPECVMVPVIGGNVDQAIVPVLSQAKPCSEFTESEIECITKQIQQAHQYVLKLKGTEAATLSTAFAIARFVVSLIKGMKGQANILECAFVETDVHPELKFMALPILLGPNGVQRDMGIPRLSTFENCLLENAILFLKASYKQSQELLGGLNAEPCDEGSDDDPCSDDIHQTTARA